MFFPHRYAICFTQSSHFFYSEVVSVRCILQVYYLDTPADRGSKYEVKLAFGYIVT